MLSQSALAALLGDALKEAMRSGQPVELDGLGVFHVSGGTPQFLPAESPKVFLAYVVEDVKAASLVYDHLAATGLNPWMDRKKLRPGQNWRRCIDRAIDTSDFFIACFSKTAAVKRGQFPYEVRYALRCADRMPLDDHFFVPVRLEECAVPHLISSHIQYVDLFPDSDPGLKRLSDSIWEEWKRRHHRPA